MSKVGDVATITKVGEQARKGGTSKEMKCPAESTLNARFKIISSWHHFQLVNIIRQPKTSLLTYDGLSST